MKQVLIIGDGQKCFFAEQVAKQQSYEVVIAEQAYTLEDVYSTCLERHYVHIVLDLDRMDEPTDQIIRLMQRIRSATDSNLIFVAAAFLGKSSLIQGLVADGHCNFIFSVIQSEQKSQLLRCMNGYYTQENIHDYIPHEVSVTKEKEPDIVPLSETRKYITIAFGAGMHRMGTTTLVLQAAKYLQANGYSACYLEFNDTGYVQSITRWLNTEEKNGETGKVTYEQVDMFDTPEKINAILKLGYDYYLYDYGVLEPRNLVSFLEKDIKVIALGSFPSEMKSTQKVLRMMYGKEICYVFNLTPEDEQEEIREMMVEKRARTFFTGFSPNPFILNLNNARLFSTMLDLERSDGKENQPRQKRRLKLIRGWKHEKV